jgi:hypothetical protein
MAAKYPTFNTAPPPPKTPSELWYSLTKIPKFRDHPRHYQMSALDEFIKAKDKHPDIAICLPTGTGKTAVGLLAGRFLQAQTPQRVLYLTPNNQLTGQVLDEARDLGVSAVDLRGPWPQIPLDRRNQYNAGTAIGVASYHTVFNSHPKVSEPQLLILDDVHAAGEAALNPWQLSINRHRHGPLFSLVRDALKAYVHPDQMSLTGDDRPPDQRGTQLVVHRDWLLAAQLLRRRVSQFFVNVQELTEELNELRFPWGGLEPILEKSFCFLSRNTVTIRPWIPPSMEIAQFRNAKNRLYLSATIDQWGHLQQVIGVETVERVGDLTVPIQGQRLIVDTGLQFPKEAAEAIVPRLAKSAKKALILVRSDEERGGLITALRKAGYTDDIWGEKPNEDVEAFKGAKKGLLILANRYDGMDLGHGACKHIIIVGLPKAIGVREQFLGEELDTVAAAEARARQRLQQAMGRCTRTDEDTAVVWLVGERLSEFVANHDVRAAFPPRLRLELAQVGALGDWKNVAALVKDCLARNEDWMGYYRSLETAAATQKEAVQLNAEVMQHQGLEARYNQKLVRGLYPDAAAAARNMAERLQKFPEAAAFWYYMAAVAHDTDSYARTRNPFSADGDAMLLKAQHGAKQRWFEYAVRPPTPGLSGEIEARVKNLEQFLRSKSATADLAMARRDQGLNSDAAAKQRLRVLGLGLGFEVPTMPDVEGEPDSVWALNGEAKWIWEAKTDKSNKTLGFDAMRQIVGQPDWVRQHMGLKVESDCKSVCLANLTEIARSGRQNADKFEVSTPEKLRGALDAVTSMLEKHAGGLPSKDEQRKAVLAAFVRATGENSEQLAKLFALQPALELPIG